MCYHNVAERQKSDNFQSRCTAQVAGFHSYLRGLGKKGGCPLPSMFWQTGTYLPEVYILKQKLLFLGHLARLPNTSLANQFYVAQKRNENFPSLVKELASYLEKWNITNIEGFSKNQWRKIINQRMYELNREKILIWSQSYKSKITTSSA